MPNNCETWKETQHLLFQLANGCFLISCLTPTNSLGIVIAHFTLSLGTLCMRNLEKIYKQEKYYFYSINSFIG